MLIIRKNQPNTLVVTVSQNSELANPQYLFSFTHNFSKEQINFIPTDISTHQSRYDEFYFVEGTGNTQINFFYEGDYRYKIYEQIPQNPPNLDPRLACNVVEYGECQVIITTANTVNRYYESYDYPNSNNSNYIFLPEWDNPVPLQITPTPTPSITPSATLTPTPSITPTLTPSSTPTNTPSVTPSLTPTNTQTLTPTPSSTPQPPDPQTLGALWWIDFTDVATLTLGVANTVSQALDKISNIPFTAATSQGPLWALGYLSISGSVIENAGQLSNTVGTYGSFNSYTWFGRIYDDPSQQRGGKIFVATNNGISWPSGQAFCLFIDPNSAPYPPGPVWRTQNRLNNGAQIQLNSNINFSTWTDIAIRSYNEPNQAVLELWQNGVIIDSGTSQNLQVVTVNDPIFSLMFDGGIDGNTEQFFFDKKLTDVEMGQMFNYLNNKY